LDPRRTLRACGSALERTARHGACGRAACCSAGCPTSAKRSKPNSPACKSAESGSPSMPDSPGPRSRASFVPPVPAVVVVHIRAAAGRIEPSFARNRATTSGCGVDALLANRVLNRTSEPRCRSNTRLLRHPLLRRRAETHVCRHRPPPLYLRHDRRGQSRDPVPSRLSGLACESARTPPSAEFQTTARSMPRR
jgi:hypothetical protein